MYVITIIVPFVMSGIRCVESKYINVYVSIRLWDIVNAVFSFYVSALVYFCLYDIELKTRRNDVT